MGMEPVGDVIGRIGAAADAIGAQFMIGPLMEAGAEFGYEGYPWPLYMIGRGGVLGDVHPQVVASAMVFPSPALVARAWAQGRASMDPSEGARRFDGLCQAWGTRALQGRDLVRTAELLERLVAGLDVSSAPLAAGWRAMPAATDRPARVAQLINVLREHRGGKHAVAVAASGLTPIEAVIGAEGELMGQMYEWEPPYPDPVTVVERKEQAEALTNRIVAASYASLDAVELDEVCGSLEEIRAALP